MPEPIQSASSFVDTNDLPPRTQSQLLRFAAAFGRAGYVRHAGHVLSIVIPCFAELRKYTSAPNSVLASESEAMASVLATVTDRGRSRAHPLGANTRLTLWECLAVLDPAAMDEEVMRLIGAMAHQLLQRPGSITQDVLRALWQVALTSGTDSQAGARAVLRGLGGGVLDRSAKHLRPSSASRVSAAATAEEASLQREWQNALGFTDEKATTFRRRQVEISPAQVVTGAMAVRQAAESGNAWAIVVALAFWIGISVLHVLRLRLLCSDEPGLMRIDRSNRFVQVDLSGVLAALAKRTTELAKPASDILRLPLPRWLSAILSALRAAAPLADNLGAALKLSPRGAPARMSGVVFGQTVGVSVAGLIKSRSLVMAGKFEQLEIVFGCLDFARIEKSTPHYRTIKHVNIVAFAASRSNVIQWGDVCPVDVPEELSIGSRMTPEDEAVHRLVAARRKALADAPRGPNAGWEVLRNLFNQMVLYTLLVVMAAFVLRGVAVIGLKASMLKYFSVTDWTDKRVGDGEGVSREFVAGSVLRRQLEFLEATAAAILKRRDAMVRRGEVMPPHAVEHLEALVRGDHDTLLLSLIEPDCIRPCGYWDILDGLDLEWPFRPDALRHAQADGYAAVTHDTGAVELILRHLTQLYRLRSDSTVLSVDGWRIDAGLTQDALLTRVGLLPEPGLVRRLKPGRTYD